MNATGNVSEVDKRPFRDWLFSIFAHDYAEKAHITRAAMAKGYGLVPMTTDGAIAGESPFVRPFPGTTVNTVTNVGAKEGSGNCGGGLAKWVAPTLIGFGGALFGTMFGFALMRSQTQPIAAPAPIPAAEGEARIKVYWGDELLEPGKDYHADVSTK